jgi:O-antigen/teichoic acid export membrane protein
MPPLHDPCTPAPLRPDRSPWGTEDLGPSIARRTLRGGLATLLAQGGLVLIGIASAAALARLLEPEAFGLVAMSAAALLVLGEFSDLGLPQAAVQRPQITHAQASALFWINATAGLAATLLGGLVAWPLGLFYGDPRVAPIVAALSLGFLVAGLGAQHQALLRRRMRFGTIAAISVVSTAGGVGVGIAAAASGAGAWSLVLLPLATTLLRTTGLWLLAGWMPSRPTRAEGVGAMLRFGGLVTGANLLAALVRAADAVLIGRFVGVAPLGFYTNAKRLLLVPVAQINAPLTAVAIPALSRLQHDPPRFRRFYAAGVAGIAAATSPAVLLAAVLAPEIVRVLLGPGWEDSVPIFQALAPAALLASLNVVTSWVYLPLGRVDRQFRWQVIRSTVTLIALPLGLPWGGFGVAVALSTSACLLRVPAILYCLHGTFLSIRDVLGAVWRPLLAAAIAAIATLLAATPLRAHLEAMPAAVLGIGGAIFIATYIATWIGVPGGGARIREIAAWRSHLRRAAGPLDLADPPDSEVPR